MTYDDQAGMNHCRALPVDTVLLSGRPLEATEACTVREIAECGGAVDVQVCDLALAPTLLPSDVLTIGLFDLDMAAAGDLVLCSDGGQCKVRRIESVLYYEGRRFGLRVADLKARRATLRSAQVVGTVLRARREGTPISLRPASSSSLLRRAVRCLQGLVRPTRMRTAATQV